MIFLTVLLIMIWGLTLSHFLKRRSEKMLYKLNVALIKLDRILSVLKPVETEDQGGLFLIIDGQLKRWAGMEAKLKPDQRVAVILNLTDKKGNPAKFDGEPAWASSDESVAAFEMIDGVRFVKHVAFGAAVISVEGDADQGEGIVPFRLEGTVSCLSGDVVAGELVFGTPEDVPAV